MTRTDSTALEHCHHPENQHVQGATGDDVMPSERKPGHEQSTTARMAMLEVKAVPSQIQT